MGGTVEEVIVTHGDLDGMVSAILVMQKTGVDVTIKYSNAKWVARTLEEISKSVDGLYITDLPVAHDCYRAFHAEITRLRRARVAIYLYDHHLCWDDEALAGPMRDCCAALVTDSGKTTAAALVWKHLLKNDPRSRRWLELLANKDRSEDPSIRRDFGALVALSQPRHYDQKSTCLQCLAGGQEAAEQVQVLADWYYDEHLPRGEELAKKAKVMQTRRGTRIAWLDLRGRDEIFVIQKEVCRLHHAPLMGSIIDKHILLGGPSIDQGIDLSSLHGEYESAEVELNITGHSSPVAIQPVDGRCNEAFVDAVKTFLRERV